ncbi:hypothetical protein V8C34DRAFT_273147 [Trichoderma compactum]
MPQASETLLLIVGLLLFRVRARCFFIVLLVLSLLDGVLIGLFDSLGGCCVQAHHKARVVWD